ncbi:hemerythrin domain-containing protein [Polyangium sp. y55x31]|uniref:hemerythrin domain-containing protein n=1 Tax=Polyangium sp. y55x31 TaxID=3042688 RepID=UPI00248270D7|nr:hemerythrin domain-containing protein [Polyangium sp. y55x31]MDI1480536.1 hemerythrin domain-containing protein [Polyangium sp. y55x31]
MKATDLLKQQHREVEELFREIEGAEDEDERASLREELANALAAHTAIEEEIFYPAAMEALGPSGRIREAFEEHAVADFALYRLMSVSVGDETFSAKLGALKDIVMNHVEEEESELLPQAEGEMERDQLEQLGDRLSARFSERLAEGHRPILERSLGIAARQVATQAPGAKKAAAPRKRAPAKRQAMPKRAAGAAQRGAAQRGTAKRGAAKAAPAKRGAAVAQKRNGGAAAGGASRTQARKTASTQKAPAARGQGASRTQSQSGGAARGGQAGGARGAQKGMARGGGARGQAVSAPRKQRARG